MESRAVFLRIKEEQKLEREMNGYMNWICRAGTYSARTTSTGRQRPLRCTITLIALLRH